jgi:hypothetical protein
MLPLGRRPPTPMISGRYLTGALVGGCFPETGATLNLEPQ